MCAGYTYLYLLWQDSKPFNVLSYRGFRETRPATARWKHSQYDPLWVFFTRFLIHTAAEMTFFFFFFLQSRVKSPKRVSLEHGFMEEANRLIPLGHELIKSKTWGQIRPGGVSRAECGSTVRSDKRMIKIKARRAAQNTQLWWQKEDNGQREGRWPG